MEQDLKFSYHNGTVVALGAASLIWFLGIGGRDLYVVPLICWLPLAGWRVWKDRSILTIRLPSEESMSKAFTYGKWVLGIVFLLCCLRAVLRYLSFQWSIWDSGIFSNIIYNLSQGDLWWSHYEVHPWADHFTPSITLLAPFYLIHPNFFWIILAKILAYCFVPLGFWQIAKHQNQQADKAIFLTLLVSSAWLLWYKPAVSSLWFEWQSSCLAPPVIVFCFLWLEKKDWIKFSLGLIFLLGLKEHMGIVPVGFGCYCILTRRNSRGIAMILITMGIISMFSLTYGLKPYFLNGLQAWTTPKLDFLGDVPGKSIYLFKLLFPLGFLPFIYFRIGILAYPAIAVNLVGREAMRSSSYHYDDVSSTLLLIAVLFILGTQDQQKYWHYFGNRTQQTILLTWIIGTSLLMPSSIGREVKSAWPTAKHFKIHQDLKEVKEKYPFEAGVAVQSSLGVHFQQREVNYIAGSNQYPCGENQADRFHQLALKRKYWLLAKGTNSFMIDELDACIHNLEKREDWKLVKGYDHISFYVKN